MMYLKKISIAILLAFFASTLFASNVSGAAAEKNISGKKKRPTVALVLCGGGAKGAAHIGALKVLERENVPIDMIVGTSMGAIIGGMYSLGYDATQLDSIISNCDWGYLLSNNTQRRNTSFTSKLTDKKCQIVVPFGSIKKRKRRGNPSVASLLPGGLVNGQNVLNLMNGLAVGYQDSISFKELPIPFACVAMNLATGDEVILQEGLLPLSLRASMAIPAFFSPVTINGDVLVDGGVVNNFPVDIAKRMGADIVIGIDVQSELAKPNELKSINQVVGQLVGLTGNAKYLENVKLADIYIKPDVTKFSTYSFDKPSIDSLIINGELATQSKVSELKSLVNRVGKREKFAVNNSAERATDIVNDTISIREIIFNGVSLDEGEWLKGLAKISSNTKMSGDDINSAISKIMGTKSFKSVTYKLSNTLNEASEGNERDLIIDLVEGPVNVFGLGLRFDTEEMASILIHAGLRENSIKGNKLFLQGRLSFNPYATLGYSYAPSKFAKIDLSYTFRGVDMNIYNNDAARNYLEFNSNIVDLGLSNKYSRNFNFKGGLRFENYHYKDLLSSDATLAALKLDNKSYLGYYLTAKMDTRDKKYFPNSGLMIDMGANFYQTNFSEKFNPFGSLNLNIAGVKSLTNRISLLPAFYSRVIIGNMREAAFANVVGGVEQGRYVPQQLLFIGMNYANYMRNSIGVVRLDVRGRIGAKHYLYAQSNYLRSASSLDKVFSRDIEDYWGFGAKYSYDSPFGPVSLNITWSDYKNKVGAYVSLGYYF